MKACGVHVLPVFCPRCASNFHVLRAQAQTVTQREVKFAEVHRELTKPRGTKTCSEHNVDWNGKSAWHRLPAPAGSLMDCFAYMSSASEACGGASKKRLRVARYYQKSDSNVSAPTASPGPVGTANACSACANYPPQSEGLQVVSPRNPVTRSNFISLEPRRLAQEQFPVILGSLMG